MGELGDNHKLDSIHKLLALTLSSLFTVTAEKQTAQQAAATPSQQAEETPAQQVPPAAGKMNNVDKTTEPNITEKQYQESVEALTSTLERDFKNPTKAMEFHKHALTVKAYMEQKDGMLSDVDQRTLDAATAVAESTTDKMAENSAALQQSLDGGEKAKALAEYRAASIKMGMAQGFKGDHLERSADRAVEDIKDLSPEEIRAGAKQMENDAMAIVKDKVISTTEPVLGAMGGSYNSIEKLAGATLNTIKEIGRTNNKLVTNMQHAGANGMAPNDLGVDSGLNAKDAPAVPELQNGARSV